MNVLNRNRYSRRQLDAEAATRAGCRRLVVVRSTGTLCGLYESGPAGMDESAGAWATVCETHGGVVNHDTRAVAESHLSHPDEWCPVCQGDDQPDGVAYENVAPLDVLVERLRSML
jgi:hypothetical protein